MIEIHAFPPAFGLTNASPFTIKLQAYCNLAGIEYTVKYRVDSDKMPKKKLPMAIINNKMVVDSNIILAELDKTYQLDKDLTPEQHALGFLLKELAEEKLYWSLVYSRWADETYWPKSSQAFFGKLPGLLKLFVPRLMRNKALKNLFSQGTGRHTPTEVYQFAKEAIDHLAVLLADKPYFIAERMTQYDCALYATLTNLLNGQLNTPIKEAIEQHQNLVDYVSRCYRTVNV